MALPTPQDILRTLEGRGFSQSFSQRNQEASRIGSSLVQQGREIAPKIGKFAVGVGQGIARETAAVGQKLLNTATFGRAPEAITPNDRLSQALYGTSKPFSVQTVGEEYPFVQKGSAVAPLLAFGGFALNAVPGGSVATKELKALRGASGQFAKAGDRAVVEALVKQNAPTLAESTSRLLADRLVAANSRSAAETAISSTFREIANSGTGKAVERGFLGSVRTAQPEVAARTAGQYIPRSTDALATQARNLIKDNIDQAESIARVGTDDKAVAIASELIKHYSDEAAKAADLGARNLNYEKAGDIANIIAEKLTESGRAVQAAAILGRLTPEGQLRFAAREINKYNELVDKGGSFAPRKKIPQLTPEQTGEILEESRRIFAMPDGEEKAMAFKALQDRVTDLIPSPLYQKLITVWKAGLLTGLKTSGLNIFSNLFHGVSEFVSDIPAAAVDSVASLFTGERTLALTARGTGSGVKEGFKKGFKYFKTGYDERDLARKLDYNRVNFGTSPFAKAAQKYEETVFRAIGSQDQPFYYGAKARSLYSQAIAKAKTARMRGREAADYVDDLVANPTDDMLRNAVVDAETAVFANETFLGNAARSIQRLGNGAGNIVVPFTRTPAAVAMQLINYSPVGIVKTIAEQVANGKFNQRQFARGIGRGITGTAAAYLGMKMFDEGILTTSWPTSEKEREQWELEGKKANSIKIGDKYRSVSVLGPIGMTLVAGGHFAQGMKDTGSPFAALLQAAAGAGKSLTEQTFLRGVNQLTEAISDPARSAENYFAGLIGSIVPTIISDVARATDENERLTPGITGRLQSRIPGVRQGLQPQINSLGEPVETPDPLTTMIDPTRPGVASTNPVVAELSRLNEAGYNATPTQLGDKFGYDILAPEENTSLMLLFGELLQNKLDRLITHPGYAQMDDEQKQAKIEEFTKKAKDIARAEAVTELTLDLKGEELKAELKRLKEAKLLTADVYQEYLRLR